MRQITEQAPNMAISLDTQAGHELLHDQLASDPRDAIVVSDFDHTLCHEYVFDPETNNKTPIVDPELARAFGRLPCMVVTGRRANNPHVGIIWSEGLLPPDIPLIAENGGVILESNGEIRSAVASTDEVDFIDEQIKALARDSLQLPAGFSLITKPGETLVVVRAQLADGSSRRDVHDFITPAIQTAVGEEWIVVDCGTTLNVQKRSVSKRTAVEQSGLQRSNYQVVSLGDSPNDIDLLDEADVAIAVGNKIAEHADFVVASNPASVTTVLQTIGRAVIARRQFRDYP